MTVVRDFSIEPDRSRQHLLRDALRQQLARWNIGDDAANRILLVIDEMVGNSIDHGVIYRHTARDLELRLSLNRHDLRIEFVDPDTPKVIVRELDQRMAKATQPPPIDAERGRGLFLIRRGLDEVAFEWRAGSGMTISGIARDVVS
jgi:anti-sigma regulatory factor (Ser/Thr protein kinase)